ncbi:MAG: hypothetical protein RL263_1208, partial [Bacteroidota bacterium]
MDTLRKSLASMALFFTPILAMAADEVIAPP